jgi:hypothetical protein
VPTVTGSARRPWYFFGVTLRTLRGSALAMVLGCVAWSAGCATTKPMVDPVFASGTYTPARVALLPPDIFVVLDQVGDNDPAQSAALGQAVTNETVRMVVETLHARGYDVDLSARWDGIVAQDGSVLVNRDELGWLANGVLQFANGPEGGGQGPMSGPRFVAPELAAKVGWATQSDALLYLNVKGVTTTNGKRAASIVAGVFIIVVVAVIVLALVASSKNNGGSSGNSSALGRGGGGSGFRGQPVARAAPSSGGGFRGAPVSGGGAAAAMPSGASGGAASGALRGGAVGGGHAASMPSGSAAGGRAAAMPSGSSGGVASGGLASGGAGAGHAASMPSGSSGPARGNLTGTPAPSGGGWHGTPPGGSAAAAPTAGGWHGTPPGGSTAAAQPAAAPSAGGWRGGAPVGRPAGAPVYRGGPNVTFGVGVFVPLDGPVYTHDGEVAHEDETFAGDELYVSMTLVSTYDGRVLWHARDHVDLDAEDNRDVDRMVQTFLGSLPPRAGLRPAAAAGPAAAPK